MSMGHTVDADGRFVIRIPGSLRDKIVAGVTADQELEGALGQMRCRRVGAQGVQWTLTVSRPLAVRLVGHLLGMRGAPLNKLGHAVAALLADHVPVRLQNAGVPDGMFEDGTLRYQMPYPFHVVGVRGAVVNADAFAGRVVRIVGFQKDLATRTLDLLWHEVYADPSRAVGMYAVTVDSAGGWATWQTAVETAEKLED